MRRQRHRPRIISAPDQAEFDTDHGHHDGNCSEGSESGTKLIRLKKPVVIRPDVGVRVDSTMVGPQFYDCFNYTLLTQGDGHS